MKKMISLEVGRDTSQKYVKCEKKLKWFLPITTITSKITI